jgi:hypothetical protein
MRDNSSIRPPQSIPLPAPAPHDPCTPEINRNIGLIEFLVSHRKQRPNKKSIATFPAHPARRNAFPAPHIPNPTPSQINRHTFLLEFVVSQRKQSPIKNLIATRTAVFPPCPKWLTSHPLALFLAHSSTSFASFTSFASYLTRLCVTISGGEVPCRT